MMAHARDAARTYGKSDPIDALAVARAALREPDLPAARLDDQTGWYDAARGGGCGHGRLLLVVMAGAPTTAGRTPADGSD